MKVWHKILVAPGVAILFLFLLGLSTYSVLRGQNATLVELFATRFGSYQLVARSSQEIAEVHSGTYRLFTWIANLNEHKVKQAKGGLLDKIDSVLKQLTAFDARGDLDPDERKIAETLVVKLAKYRKDVDNAIELSTVDLNTGIAAMQTADYDFQDLTKDFSGLVEIETRLAQQRYDGAVDAFARVTIILLTIVTLAVATSLGIALYMSRRIVRPLGDAIAVAGRIASGDLNSQIKLEGRDETAALLRALTDMNHSLRRIVGGVRNSTDLVASASREITQGNSDLSTRTEQQASALEETSASLQQIAATVGQNAQNAKKANELATQASVIAAKGGDMVREAIGTMSGITNSSEKIADIIGVIDGIAFQTNILALNAAVEAARAGEQGRGFAVVATEVRSLAQRSAAAAKEIKDLITDSAIKVAAGSHQVDDAGRTMVEIVASVKKVSNLIAEIAAASQEQAQGIEQVSETMTQLEKVTQQNAAMVEQAGAAAGSLERQFQALSEAVAAFRLGDAPKRAPAPRLEKKQERVVPAVPATPETAKAKPQLERARIAPRRRAAPPQAEGWQEF